MFIVEVDKNMSDSWEKISVLTTVIMNSWWRNWCSYSR